MLFAARGRDREGRRMPGIASLLGALLLGAILIPTAAGAQQRPDSLMLLLPTAITEWSEGRIRGVSGLQLYGNFNEGPYVGRTRFQDGTGIGPHQHTNTTTITVLTGLFHLGIGAQVDSSAARTYPPGSFLVIPAGVAHYEWGEGETIIQLSGVGPLGFTRLTPDQ